MKLSRRYIFENKQNNTKLNEYICDVTYMKYVYLKNDEISTRSDAKLDLIEFTKYKTCNLLVDLR